MKRIRTGKNASLGAVGERGFLARFVPRGGGSPLKGFLVPPGDDAAVLSGRPADVLSIDGMVENVHFRLDWAARLRGLGISLPRALGWKAVGGALSDLAAMGDVDRRWAMVFLGAPPAMRLAFLDEFRRGVEETARRYQCRLAGGDTVRARDLTVAVAVGGRLRGRPLTRSGAKTGDVLAVAGTIGDAALGFRALKARSASRSSRYFVERFFAATPMFAAGRSLAVSPGVGAVLDLSDSLDVSLRILFESGRLGAEIDTDALPVSPSFRSAGGALTDLIGFGEDYALLFSLRPSALAALRRRLPLTPIGRVVSDGGIRYLRRGRRVPTPRSFEHFS